MTSGPEDLGGQLRSIDGRDYGAYQSLRGRWEFDGFDLEVAVVPKDPYAPPGTSVCRVRVPLGRAGIIADDLTTPAREVAVRDHLARRFHAAAARLCGGRRGTGWSGVLTVAEPGQAVLDRNAVVLDGDVIEVRAFIGWAGRGRRVDAGLSATLVLEELPAVVAASLDRRSLDREALTDHVHAVEDAQALRSALAGAGLVAFLGEGAVLPRASGVDRRPLTDGAVPLAVPSGLAVTLDTPHSGPITGLGIGTGVTMIVGGGYHGKSTLLDAIATGVHDRLPGDGRERCVSDPSAAVVRAAPGRSVAGVDVSGFISSLPDGRSTSALSTGNASGSTSQAAAISEALEAGARLLLIDEDTSANNLLVRDARMQRLVAEEPLTALVDRVRELHDVAGVSTIVAVGGAGDWLDVADRVVHLQRYLPSDATGAAARVATDLPSRRRRGSPSPWTAPRGRAPVAGSVATRNEHGKRSVRAVARDRLVLGGNEVDLRDIADQLDELGQAATLAVAIERLAEDFDGTRTVRAIAEELVEELTRDGLDVLDPKRRGTLAAVRTVDLAGALNRVRGLVVTQPGDPTPR